MFSIFKKKKASRLFLGAIVVVPRNEFKKMDEWSLLRGDNLEDSVKQRLLDIFSLPLVHDYESFTDSDLALEIIVSNLQGGELTSMQISPIDIPIMWRPKIQLKARLYFINSGKTQSTYEVIYKMPWSQYFHRALSYRGLVRVKPLFEPKDLEPILYSACEQLLRKMVKAR